MDFFTTIHHTIQRVVHNMREDGVNDSDASDTYSDSLQFPDIPASEQSIVHSFPVEGAELVTAGGGNIIG